MRLKQSLRALMASSVLLCTALFGLMVVPYRPVSLSVRTATLEPECQCTFDGEQYDFCYRLPPDNNVKGRRFNCTYAHHLQRLDLLSPKNVLNFELHQLPNPPFVAAISQNHYKEGLTMIENIRKFWPQARIYIYDLGLNNSSLDQLKEVCKLEVRHFPFEDYPTYVKNLVEYRWKPLIIAETLNEFKAVWYMDTSIRWKEDKLNEIHSQVTCRKDRKRIEDTSMLDNATILCRKSAYLLHHLSGHGTYPTNHPGLYTYIPTRIERLKNKTESYDAGFVFAAKTIDSFDILKWTVLCALEKDCMAPPGAQLYCKFAKFDLYTQYANCHRYDQSVINLLLANAYGYDARNYVSSVGNGAFIERKVNIKLTVKDLVCNDTESSWHILNPKTSNN